MVDSVNKQVLLGAAFAFLLLLSGTTSAHANGSGVVLPGDALLGMPAGAALAGGVLLIEAIAGAEFHKALIAPPFALVNFGLGAAACTAVSLAPRAFADSLSMEIAYATAGMVLMLHGAASVLVYTLWPPPDEDDLRFAVDTDLRTSLSVGLTGSL